MKNQQKGIGLTLLSAVFNASTYIVPPLALILTNVENMLIFWFLWAIIIFFSFFALQKQAKKFLNIIRNKKIAFLGIVNSVSAILWTYGVLYAGPALTSFVFRFDIVFTVIIGIIILKEKLSRMDMLGITIAIVGAFVTAYSATELIIFSTIIILIAALFSSISIILAKIYVKNIDSLSLAAGRSVYIFLSVLVVSIFFGRIQIPTINLLFLTFFAGFVGAFLGFFTFYKSLSFYEVSKAMAVRSIEPFFASIFSLIILFMVPSVNQMIGGFIIIAGVIILALKGSFYSKKRV